MSRLTQDELNKLIDEVDAVLVARLKEKSLWKKSKRPAYPEFRDK